LDFRDGHTVIPMRRPLPVIALCLAALALSSIAATQGVAAASSKPNPLFPRVARFYLRGSHGYKVTVVAALEGPGSPVRVIVEDHEGGAEYQVPGTVTRHGIHASFGQLGVISLRFRPSGRVLHSQTEGGGCSLRAKAHLGAFVGAFRFQGEGGYTTVDTHRVQGGFGAPTAPINEREQMKLGCLNAAETHIMAPEQIAQRLSTATTTPGESTPGLGVFAAASALDEATLFGAWRFSLRHPEEEGATPEACIFFALREETRGEMDIARTALSGGPLSQCPYDETSGTFIATPDRPFSGSATFQRNADGSTSWLGPLAVPMLGLGVVPLTGPGFTGKLLEK
jgi:hypothetical protein